MFCVSRHSRMEDRTFSVVSKEVWIVSFWLLPLGFC